MRKLNFSRFTPLMRIGILLTLSILTVHFCHGLIDTLVWLVVTIMTYGIAFVAKGELRQSLLLHLCLFSSGALLASHQMDTQQEVIRTRNEEELSSLDKALMTTQDVRRQLHQEMYDLHADEQDFAVLSAMTLGDKSFLSQETKDIYSISGASHVLAVSGLHIGIIFQFFILLMGGRRRSPIVIFLSLIAIWSYVFFIGLPPSAVRSATLISICSFALLANKEPLSLNNLSLAYVIMLIVHPSYLFDISFQMSFMAVFSILLFLPTKKSNWLVSVFRMSLAAQIGTIPLIIYYFGRLSCYSLLTSFIAIPAATLILYFSAISFLSGMLSALPVASILFTPLLHLSTSCLVSITQACNTALKLITMLPGASIDGIKINIPQLCLIYVSIAVGYTLWKKYYS